MKSKKVLGVLISIIFIFGFAGVVCAATGMNFSQLCGNGTIDEVRAAIENGADVNAKQHNGETPLYSAVKNENPDVVSLLITKGADVNAKVSGGGTVAMMVAYMFQDPIPVMRILINNGADVNLQDEAGMTALIYAVVAMRQNPEKAIALLLDSGANPNLKDSRGETALDIAIGMGRYEGTEILKRLESVTSAKSN